MDIQIGGVPASTEPVERMSTLIWGPAGGGKTTLACTMPGRKALINFDPDGPSSIANFPNVDVFDLSGSGSAIANSFKSDDAFNLGKASEVYDSFIIDSLSTITERTLARGVEITKGATVERPSPGAYMARNNLAITLIRNVLQITAKHKRHVCFIAHEGAPDKNEDGIITSITMSLGGQLPNQAALRINECWCLFENGKNDKMLLVRKARLREPLKSRMFDTAGGPEFVWKFDPTNFDAASNMHMATWWDMWKFNKFNKLPLPGSAAFDKIKEQMNNARTNQ